MPNQEVVFFEQEHSPGNLKEKVAAYTSKWPLFILFTLISVGLGIFYIRHIPPKYYAEAPIMVISNDENKASKDDLIESAISGNKEVNLNNEILVIESSSLMKRTVAKNDFNIQYLIKGRLVDIDIYKEAPFTLVPQHIVDSTKSYRF